MIDVRNIILSDDEIKKCREFCCASASQQQLIEFGQTTTKERKKEEVTRDNLIGKIGEFAFSKMMRENYSINVELDLNCYPRGQWDDQDAEINGWRIDVKATRIGGEWMLIEWNKLDFRQRENRLPHLFVMFSVGWDRISDQPTGRAIFEGAASISRLQRKIKNTYILYQGKNIPGTSTRLLADNYGIPFRCLEKDLDQLVQLLISSPPYKSMTDHYRNPFDQKTTIEILSESASV